MILMLGISEYLYVLHRNSAQRQVLLKSAFFYSLEKIIIKVTIQWKTSNQSKERNKNHSYHIVMASHRTDLGSEVSHRRGVFDQRRVRRRSKSVGCYRGHGINTTAHQNRQSTRSDCCSEATAVYTPRCHTGNHYPLCKKSESEASVRLFQLAVASTPELIKKAGGNWRRVRIISVGISQYSPSRPLSFPWWC